MHGKKPRTYAQISPLHPRNMFVRKKSTTISVTTQTRQTTKILGSEGAGKLTRQLAFPPQPLGTRISYEEALVLGGLFCLGGSSSFAQRFKYGKRQLRFGQQLRHRQFLKTYLNLRVTHQKGPINHILQISAPRQSNDPTSFSARKSLGGCSMGMGSSQHGWEFIETLSRAQYRPNSPIPFAAMVIDSR